MSKVLKLNGEVVHKVNGKYVKKVNDDFVQCGAITIPKGTIINVDFNGDGEVEPYRVLECKITNTAVECELMCMYDWAKSKYYEDGIHATFSNGVIGLKYEDSLVDEQVGLFYDRLLYKVKQSILPQHKEQEMWEYTYLGDTPGTIAEDGYYGTINYRDNDYYKLTKQEGVLDLGERKVYLPSVEKIMQYLGKEYGDITTYEEVYEMFYESEEMGNITDSVWLMDASFRGTPEDNQNKNAMFFANRQYGNLANYHYHNVFGVRPIFVVDLLKLMDVYNMVIEF